jgi:cellulose biosynthesis protein BcsQ
MTYCIWNNKGGVGKTFLTYCLATEYALKNQKTCVVVVDMCPQANISEILLGGNGTGADNLAKLDEQKLTIAHYISRRLINPYQTDLIGTESNFFIRPDKYNDKIPENVRLVAGSSELDLYSKGIEFYANTGNFSGQPKAWTIIKSWLKSLCDVQKRNLDSQYEKTIFFIDCNPSFSPYTELALVASDRLIVPCTADGGSVRALKNLFKVIYGVGILPESNMPTFYKEMQINNLPLPKISMIIQNRHRTKKKGGETKKDLTSAFAGVKNNITSVQQEYLLKCPEYFSQSTGIYDVKDGNTLAPIISYNGDLLSQLKAQKYRVYQKHSQTNEKQIEGLKEDINHILQNIIND